jgi:ABC-type uncharacterized transport system substrate-binding protein
MLMRYLQQLKPGLVLLVTALSSGIALAHPHVWVTVETEVLVSPDNEITGFRNKWTFDEGYTNFAIEGLDTNGDGVYSEEELKPLAETNIEALKEFEYFTFPFIGETKLPTKAPVDYRLDYKDKLLTLTFTLPLDKPVSHDRIKDFSFAVYDPGMYVSLTFAGNEPVKIASAKPVACAAHVGDRDAAKTKAKARVKETTLSQLGENIDPASNLGYQYAERVTIQCKP